MAKIKIYKPSGEQKKGKKIEKIDISDNFEEQKQMKSELMKKQCATRVKAKDVVVSDYADENQNGFGM
ncbi:MAG: hypothetical protein IJA23_05905 [Clostridia bacterium]|nr:hypothetical protein [Clostridia bacterium]